MRKIVATEYVTLDGRYENPAWTVPYWQDGDAVAQLQQALLFDSGALLLGRVTYEGFALAWPEMKDGDGFAQRMNSLPKHVVTAATEPLTWNATAIQGDIFAEIRELKRQEGKNLLVYGSGQLLKALLQEGLVDVLRLMTYPLLLGEGARLLDGTDQTMKLVDVQTTEKGVVVTTYARLEDA